MSLTLLFPSNKNCVCCYFMLKLFPSRINWKNIFYQKITSIDLIDETTWKKYISKNSCSIAIVVVSIVYKPQKILFTRITNKYVSHSIACVFDDHLRLKIHLFSNIVKFQQVFWVHNGVLAAKFRATTKLAEPSRHKL